MPPTAGQGRPKQAKRHISLIPAAYRRTLSVGGRSARLPRPDLGSRGSGEFGPGPRPAADLGKQAGVFCVTPPVCKPALVGRFAPRRRLELRCNSPGGAMGEEGSRAAVSSMWIGMDRRGTAVPRDAQLCELPQPVGTPGGHAASHRRAVVRPLPQHPGAAEACYPREASPVKDVAARPVRPQLRSVAGAGGVGALAGGETRTVVSPPAKPL